jgi:hypothetical protein
LNGLDRLKSGYTLVFVNLMTMVIILIQKILLPDGYPMNPPGEDP